MALNDLFVYVRDGGTIAVLLLIIVGGYRRWFVWGWYAEEQAKRIIELEARLERAVRAAEQQAIANSRAISVAERRVEAGDER